MKREMKVVKVKNTAELRGLINECLIEHSEKRSLAMNTGNLHLFFYCQGFMDALRTIRDAIGEEGLTLYRYVRDEAEERNYGNESYQ